MILKTMKSRKKTPKQPIEPRCFLAKKEKMISDKLNSVAKLEEVECSKLKNEVIIPKSIPIFATNHKIILNVKKLDQAIEIIPGEILVSYLLDTPKDIVFALTIYLKSLLEIEVKKYVQRVAKELKLKYNKIYIKERDNHWKSNWSTCSEINDLYFSWRLVFAPRYVMEYIVVCELCRQIKIGSRWRFRGAINMLCPKNALAKHWLEKYSKKINSLLVIRS
ncbi:MAG: M48 family metallopeptidase [Rickettsiales bacterium]|jgi:predicted metal-dependent hydrolase|nr:M48 family metallopeptidase [Rickettsiales bacterium]